MSIGHMAVLARRNNAVTKTAATVERRTVASSWAEDATSRLPVHYYQTPPLRGERLDFEAGNGYGKTFEFGDPETTIAHGDLLVIITSMVAADIGTEWQVQQIPERSSLTDVLKVDTVRRS